MDKELLENYAQGMLAFPTELTEHFPNELRYEKKLLVSYPSGVYATGMANMIFSHQVDSLQINKLKLKIELNKLKEYKSNDTVFIVVGDTLDYSKKTNGIPITSFEYFKTDFGKSNKYLPDYYKIYVIESKKGKYLEEKDLSSGKNLPPNWKNGFSRGIGINPKENEILYWLCVW